MILVLSKPLKVIYNEINQRIGCPKDYEIIKKDGFTEKCIVDIKIPKNVL